MQGSIRFDRCSIADDVLADLDLSCRTTLITGCSSGIGFETFRALAVWDAHVIGLARSVRPHDSYASGSSTPAACDVADLDSVNAACATVMKLEAPLAVHEYRWR